VFKHDGLDRELVDEIREMDVVAQETTTYIEQRQLLRPTPEVVEEIEYMKQLENGFLHRSR
jgi:hypothetical protein